MQIAVGNGRHYGGGLTIDETAAIDDGWLQVYYLKPAGLLAMLWMLPALRFGWLRRSPDAEVRRAKRVEIRTRRRSEEHTSELQSLMRISYAVFCLKKKTTKSIYKSASTTNERYQ